MPSSSAGHRAATVVTAIDVTLPEPLPGSSSWPPRSPILLSETLGLSRPHLDAGGPAALASPGPAAVPESHFGEPAPDPGPPDPSVRPDISLAGTPVARLGLDRLLGHARTSSRLSTPGAPCCSSPVRPTWWARWSSRADVLPAPGGQADKPRTPCRPSRTSGRGTSLELGRRRTPSSPPSTVSRSAQPRWPRFPNHPGRRHGGRGQVQRPNIRAMVRRTRQHGDLARQAERRVTTARTMNLWP
jgi:hypothetical protein